jgi:hypothetical protein
VRIARGKHWLASLLKVLFGPALRKVSGVYLELNPWTESDRWAGMEGLLEKLSGAAFVIEITPEWLLENGSSAEELYDFLQRRGWMARGAIRSSDQCDQWNEIFANIS